MRKIEKNIMPSRIIGLDILRSIAILLVLVLHSHIFFPVISTQYPRIFFFGWAGVDLFFVLSGFLVGMQALQEKARHPRGIFIFWLKRWSRTLPLYFVLLVVYMAVKPMLGFPFIGEKLPYLFFTQNFFHPQDFVQSWSLCIEEQFYLILPLLFFALSFLARKPTFWVFVMLSSAVLRFYVLNTHGAITLSDAAYLIQFPTYTHLDGLAMGMILALRKENWLKWSQAKKILCATFGLLLLITVFIFAAPTLNNNSVIWTFSALAIGFAALVPWAMGLQANVLSQSLFTKIALWSYSLYLWNNLIFRAAEQIPAPPPMQGVLAWIGLFIFSMFSYRWIELPVLLWRDRLLQKRNAH